MDKRAKFWIEELNLKKHPEGGYYRETFRSPEMLDASVLPARFNGDRHLYSSIYFLLDRKDFSAFHQLHADEIWHFYEGSPIRIYTLEGEGTMAVSRLGRNPRHRESLQLLVEKNKWFAAELVDKEGYALVGCTTAPGFDFDDFFLARPEALEKQYPEYKDLIARFTL